MQEIIDSHCHVQFPQYDEDREALISKCKEAGVGMICIGTDFKSSASGIDLVQKNEKMWATVGLHPNDNLDEVLDLNLYRELLAKPKVVAVGEIGLDYFRTDKESDQKIQKQRFIQQLDLAVEFNLPVVLHCRDGKTGSTGRAYPDMIEILKKYPTIKGVVHSCTASLDEAKQFLDLGFYLGFNGIITFARQYDEVVKFALLERILLETDAPYLTPEPHRGKRNEPAHVLEVAKKLALLKNETLDKVISQTTENCQKLFNL
ncbi:MAG: TatD family hydrolase [Candidatus Pacebacteria bacterium]|nr:TatD family hydrolase [Candidatus Paceibacterota bacterium]